MWLVALISIVLNYCLLYITTTFFGSMFSSHHHLPSVATAIFSALILVIIPSILAISPIGEYTLSIWLHLRITTPEEQNILNPIKENIAYQINRLCKTSYTATSIKIKIKEDNQPKVFACGMNTLVVTNLALAHMHPQQLQQELLQELYKLHHKYPAIINVVYLSNWVILLCYYLLHKLQLVSLSNNLFYQLKFPWIIPAAILVLICLPFVLVINLWYKGLGLVINYINNYVDNKAYLAASS